MFRKLWKTVTWLVFLFWVFGAIYLIVTEIFYSNWEEWCHENTTCEETKCCWEAYN